MEGELVLALAALFGTFAFISNAISVFIVPDRLGRRKMLLAGCVWVVATEIYAAVMQRKFENTDNRVGKGFAIAELYVFFVGYCMSYLLRYLSRAVTDY
jgi:MFS family permease